MESNNSRIIVPSIDLYAHKRLHIRPIEQFLLPSDGHEIFFTILKIDAWKKFIKKKLSNLTKCRKEIKISSRRLLINYYNVYIIKSRL